MEKRIKENIEGVRARIEAAAVRAGRRPEDVTLLAATKNRTPEEVRRAVEAGITVAGENRVQEMLAKVPQVGAGVEWHFIGHLQRNKARQVVGEVALIHSVDSVRLAEEIDRRAGQVGVVQAVLLQVSLAGEESKSGFEPEGLADVVESLVRLGNIEVRGLSTIAPFAGDPEDVRPIFRRLSELRGELDAARQGFECRELSMGMTNDYEVAVEEGSTCVRIGTAIFGPRVATGEAPADRASQGM
jgi:pyridoxal phosphate enzyme (YggS family)